LLILLQQDVDVYTSMPPMPNITCPQHLQPSAYQKPVFHPSYDPVSIDNNQDSDVGHTLAKVIKGEGKKTAQERESSPSDDLFPSHPQGPRATAQKHKASASPAGDDIGASR
jgi:hypothetical protein